jgi:F0F1-type ATP synthase assembly protein I
MAINSVGTGSADLAAQIISAQSSQAASEKDIALLKDALQIQEDMMSGILKSLGIGQNVDIVV